MPNQVRQSSGRGIDVRTLLQEAEAKTARRTCDGRHERMGLAILLIFAFLVGGCVQQPVAPAPVTGAPPNADIVVSLSLQPRTHTVRVSIEGVEKVTRVAVRLDWDGDLWWAGIAKNPWWFANSSWAYAFSLDRNHRTMAFEVWRENPVEGSGSVGLLQFRPDHPFPALLQGTAWVNERQVPLKVRVRGEVDSVEGESFSSLEKDSGR